jgi:hypothetical protein
VLAADIYETRIISTGKTLLFCIEAHGNPLTRRKNQMPSAKFLACTWVRFYRPRSLKATPLEPQNGGPFWTPYFVVSDDILIVWCSKRGSILVLIFRSPWARVLEPNGGAEAHGFGIPGPPIILPRQAKYGLKDVYLTRS